MNNNHYYYWQKIFNFYYQRGFSKPIYQEIPQEIQLQQHFTQHKKQQVHKHLLGTMSTDLPHPNSPQRQTKTLATNKTTSAKQELANQKSYKTNHQQSIQQRNRFKNIPLPPKFNETTNTVTTTCTISIGSNDAIRSIWTTTSITAPSTILASVNSNPIATALETQQTFSSILNTSTNSSLIMVPNNYLIPSPSQLTSHSKQAFLTFSSHQQLPFPSLQTFSTATMSSLPSSSLSLLGNSNMNNKNNFNNPNDMHLCYKNSIVDENQQRDPNIVDCCLSLASTCGGGNTAEYSFPPQVIQQQETFIQFAQQNVPLQEQQQQQQQQQETNNLNDNRNYNNIYINSNNNNMKSKSHNKNSFVDEFTNFVINNNNCNNLEQKSLSKISNLISNRNGRNSRKVATPRTVQVLLTRKVNPNSTVVTTPTTVMNGGVITVSSAPVATTTSTSQNQQQQQPTTILKVPTPTLVSSSTSGGNSSSNNATTPQPPTTHIISSSSGNPQQETLLIEEDLDDDDDCGLIHNAIDTSTSSVVSSSDFASLQAAAAAAAAAASTAQILRKFRIPKGTALTAKISENSNSTFTIVPATSSIQQEATTTTMVPSPLSSNEGACVTSNTTASILIAGSPNCSLEDEVASPNTTELIEEIEEETLEAEILEAEENCQDIDDHDFDNDEDHETITVLGDADEIDESQFLDDTDDHDIETIDADEGDLHDEDGLDEEFLESADDETTMSATTNLTPTTVLIPTHHQNGNGQGNQQQLPAIQLQTLQPNGTVTCFNLPPNTILLQSPDGAILATTTTSHHHQQHPQIITIQDWNGNVSATTSATTNNTSVGNVTSSTCPTEIINLTQSNGANHDQNQSSGTTINQHLVAQSATGNTTASSVAAAVVAQAQAQAQANAEVYKAQIIA